MNYTHKVSLVSIEAIFELLLEVLHVVLVDKSAVVLLAFVAVEVVQ